MPEQPHITLANKLSDYDHHAIAWESTGTCQKKYCVQHGLGYSQFVIARSRLISKRIANTPSPFVEVLPTTERPSRAARHAETQLIKIKTSNGSLIELPQSIDSVVLATLIKSLGPTL
jgi:hypothetical protein